MKDLLIITTIALIFFIIAFMTTIENQFEGKVVSITPNFDNDYYLVLLEGVGADDSEKGVRYKEIKIQSYILSELIKEGDTLLVKYSLFNSSNDYSYITIINKDDTND